MLKILTIIGARPQFIKAAAISRAIQHHFSNQLKEVLLHTGQHYDQNMSQVFFEELGIPKPAFVLASDNGGRLFLEEMKKQIGDIIKQVNADVVLVYGDTDSTLAGAEAAAMVNVPLIHVEAGLRSFNSDMPEEYNRVRTDQLSQLLFAPTDAAINHLKAEGIPAENSNVHLYKTGDVMFDNALHFSQLPMNRDTICLNYDIGKDFILTTVHRNFNTDSQERLTQIINGLIDISEQHQVIFPMHPRTKARIMELDQSIQTKLERASKVKVIPPVSYLDIITLIQQSKLVITDSGGIQKEAFFFKTPSLVLREETEWEELVENGNTFLSEVNPEKMKQRLEELLAIDNFSYPSFYGDGKAAEFMCQKIIDHFA